MNRLALERASIRPGESVLEIGFGGGGLIAMMLAAGAGTVTGVDLSEPMVARARRRFRAQSDKVHLHRASAEALSLADGSVDAALSVNSLYFWPDVEAALAELARVVRPGGRLVLCFEPPEELRKWPGHRFGFRLFEVEEMKGLMKSAGFGGIREAWGTGRKPDRFCCLSGTLSDANGSDDGKPARS
ncbi:MAG TPA: methyltransferase domain-containing protein [Allosphingosinicella sp.]|nr:methyltransferase domain-containing protein [Allosphingosinicella sp.]